MNLRRRLLDNFHADTCERAKDIHQITPVGLALGFWFALCLFVPGQAMAILFVKMITLPFCLAIAYWIRLVRRRAR